MARRPLRSAELAVDEAALTCALEALRDATVGTVHWSSSDLDYPEAHGSVSVLDGGRMIRASVYSQIVCGGADPITLGTLPPASFYQECLDNPDVRARFDCLAAAPAEVEVECAPGYYDCGDQ